jgi:glyoxylase-like metal-dependent hydrolase (beta-lactamase superfamily II)
VGPLQTNCYLLACKETNQAVVIDPGAEGKRILNVIKKEGWEVKYIINTHGHGDHIGANWEIKEGTEAKLFIHHLDAGCLTDPSKSLLSFLGEKPVSFAADKLLQHGDKVNVGNLELDIIHTPGHTPGGISIKAGSILFTGDTLFAGAIGRTDFPGGSLNQLLAAVKDRLFCLGDDFVIYPGHGPSSTIGEERIYNPFF